MEYAIVVHKDSPLSELPASDIKRIFLGKMKKWPDGSAITIVLNTSNSIHNQFSHSMLKKSPRQLSVYWKKKLFSGKSMLPLAVDKNDAVISHVRTNMASISYIDVNALDESVKQVKIIE